MPQDQPTPGRLESFSDGVIAVILTIMVLEFKVPRLDGLAGLVPLLPTLAVYIISFGYTGVYWINHHHTLHRLKHVDAPILYSNLLLLFWLSLLPFFTQNLVDKHLSPFSVELYAVELLLSALSYSLFNLAVERNVCRGGHREHWREVLTQRAGRKKGLITQGTYLLSVALAYRAPALALALIGLVTLIWVVPGFGVRPTAEQPDLRDSGPEPPESDSGQAI